MLKINYHTHCYRCNHATGTEEDYVLAAIKYGYTTLGISDHMPVDYNAVSMRMNFNEINDYLNNLYYLKDKYNNKIDLKIGFEAEYLEDQLHYQEDLIKNNKIDYLIFGNHYHNKVDSNNRIVGNKDLNALFNYLNDIEKGFKTGLYILLAHPDLYMARRNNWDDECIMLANEISKLALKYNIPLEVNSEGFRNKQGYPDRRFWEIAKQYKVKVIIGADAHSPEALNDYGVRKAIKLANDLELNILSEEEIKALI